MNRTFRLLLVISAMVWGISSCSSPVTSTAVNLEWTHQSSHNGKLPKPGISQEQTASLILDADRNGVNDFVIASRKQGSSIVWYRKVDRGWQKYLVEPETLPIEAGGTFYDIDNDGDLDLIFGGDSSSNQIWWWENPYPEYEIGRGWQRRIIKNSGGKKHHDQIVGDFDGDGNVELVFWNQRAEGNYNKLFIADVPKNPRKTEPWSYSEIYATKARSEGLAKADLDRDGKTDLIAGGYWFKHQEGTAYEPNEIDKTQTFTRAAVGQLKKGGAPEVVFVVGDGKGKLKWYERKGQSWIGKNLLTEEVDHGHSLDVIDINGDGKLDIFCAEMRLKGKNPDAKMWLFLGDGRGNFARQVVATGYGNHESKVADLDGDGDLDILGKPYNWETPRVDIWLNKQKWLRHEIDARKPWRSIFIRSADLNGDRYPDLITGAWWYQNPGEIAGKWQRHEIGQHLNNMAAVYDFDRDGDMDILGTQGKDSEPNANFIWGKNNGKGKFTIFSNIAPARGDFLQGVAVNSYQDNDLQVALSWHKSSQGLQMLTLPTQPEREVWNWQTISKVSQDEALSNGDIDGDGDVDLLLGTKWLSNEGSSWQAHTLNATEDEPDRNVLLDLNHDDKLDAIVGFEAISKPGKLAWYEQQDSATGLWQEHIIATDIIGPMSLDLGDLDGDGDFDIVVGEHNTASPTDAKLYWLENQDSKGKSWEKHLVSVGDEHHDGTQLVDLDLDGDLDIISIGWTHNKVLVYENLAPLADKSQSSAFVK